LQVSFYEGKKKKPTHQPIFWKGGNFFNFHYNLEVLYYWHIEWIITIIIMIFKNNENNKSAKDSYLFLSFLLPPKKKQNKTKQTNKGAWGNLEEYLVNRFSYRYCRYFSSVIRLIWLFLGKISPNFGTLPITKNWKKITTPAPGPPTTLVNEFFESPNTC
jgi:hypothetical protein